jgi:DNA (cytosine-5)-methyltransferase 1
VSGLVLSLFGGLGLLDEAFRLEGFTVVRGPDLLWSQDIRDFHPPSGVFEGVIGGPPCQPFSQLVHMVRQNGYEPRHANLIPDFERVAAEARPEWFLMEEVPAAPLPAVNGYAVRDCLLNNRWFGGTQNRKRRVSFGTRDGRGLPFDVECFEPSEWDFAVSGDARSRPAALLSGLRPKKARESGGVTSSLNRGGAVLGVKEMLRLQGLPETWLDDSPFTVSAKRQMIGNGVPLPLGRAIARAVSRAMQREGVAS